MLLRYNKLCATILATCRLTAGFFLGRLPSLSLSGAHGMTQVARSGPKFMPRGKLSRLGTCWALFCPFYSGNFGIFLRSWDFFFLVHWGAMISIRFPFTRGTCCLNFGYQKQLPPRVSYPIPLVGLGRSLFGDIPKVVPTISREVSWNYHVWYCLMIKPPFFHILGFPWPWRYPKFARWFIS